MRHSSFHIALAVLLPILSLPLSTCLAAPLGTVFTYQGRLSEGGRPANGNYELQFELFDLPVLGNQIGVPLTNAVTVADGLFTATLDFGAEAFTGEARWLRLGVRTNGSTGEFTTLMRRQPLTPTPHALVAGAAKAVPASGVLGILPDARLSANVARLDAHQTFTGATRFAGAVRMTNAANAVAGTFSGDGAGLTNLNATQLTGAISPENIAAGTISGAMLAPGAVAAEQLADGTVTAAKMATVTNWHTLTIGNPEPDASDYFGCSVAAVGSDWVLIGADRDATGVGWIWEGAAYLFSTDGGLLTTFTNPTPAASDSFGWALAALGTGRVLIGAYGDDTGAEDAGAAYLFRTDGTLLTTFQKPTPASNDWFGWAVAALGTDRVLIGANCDDTGATNAGAVYLFNTAGALLTVFTNPTPGVGDRFGASLAAVGTDRVLIGAPYDDTGEDDAGAAYLFNTNGVLLASFFHHRPAANDKFGSSVAAVGTDRVLIGVPEDDRGAMDAGAAYLFNTNGARITTFSKPTPGAFELFGCSVAAIGTEHVLIGADHDNTGAIQAGAAYLFGTNGGLLATFANPTPAMNNLFGSSVAAVGLGRVLIGEPADRTGLHQAGAAYLFSLDTYTPGLIADGVNAGSITTASLADGAVIASKIGGVLSASQIPGLDASSISSGVLETNRIPNLDASKITSGTLADARLSTNVALLDAHQNFTGRPAFNGGTSGTDSPFAVDSTNRVDRLNADLLDGLEKSGFWQTDGNAGHSARFLGTTVNEPLEMKVNNLRALRLEFAGDSNEDPDSEPDGAPNLIGGAPGNFVARGIVGATIAGGGATNWSGSASSNTIRSDFGVISGGSDNLISSTAGFSAIGGGYENVILAAATFATIPGGCRNSATAQAFAAGTGARATHIGSFVWADSAGGEFMSFAENSVSFRCNGGVRFSTGIGAANQSVTWTPGSGSWSFSSDRNLKEDFAPVNSAEVLDKVARLPIREWSYQEYPQRHIGPMAQDFHALFPLNDSDTTLNSADLDGVALAAIQGLNAKVQEGLRRSEVKTQKSEVRIQKLEAENAELKRRLEKLESLLLRSANH